MQLLHRCLEQLLHRRIRLAELSYFRQAYLGIAGQLRTFEAFQLAFTRFLHSWTNRPGIFDVALIDQFFVIETGDFDVDVDTVQERATDLLLVAGNGHDGTTTLFYRVTVKSTRAGVQTVVGGSPGILSTYLPS